MLAWLTIPSVRPVCELDARLSKWKEMGYGIALLRQGCPSHIADIQIPTDKYLGWARSINVLARLVLSVHSDCQFCIGGGDDTLPDPNYQADMIVAQCMQHFGGTTGSGTFGMMQPVGDRWQDTAQSRQQFGEHRGAIIDRIAGSPWIGREYAERMYGGTGALSEHHWHCWSDEEAQLVAERLGVFWQRRDLTQKHEHWLRDNANLTGRKDEPQSWAVADADYRNGRALFEERKQFGFPGSNPLEKR